MAKSELERLDSSDSKFINARYAGKRLLDFYELKTKTHYIFLPVYNIRICISEIGSGEPSWQPIE